MSVKVILSGVQSLLKRLHIDAHRSMIAALAVVLAVAGLVAPRYGRSQQTPAPKQKVDAAAGASFTSRAQSEIRTGEGVQLKLTKFEKGYAGTAYSYIIPCPESGGAIPDDVPASGVRSFCYGSWHPPSTLFEIDTGFYFYYDILVPNGTGGWRPSGYYVDGAAKVPQHGDRKIDCTIKQSGSTDPAVGAPFRCDVSWTGEKHSSNPHWKVTANEVKVIDAANSANVERAAELIGANCTVHDTPRCKWNRTGKSRVFAADRKDWVALTSWADSCPPATREFELTANRNAQISWSDKVGGKIGVKVTGDVLVAKVEGSLEANYEHMIAQTQSYGDGYKYYVPMKWKAALYVVFGFLEATGDFSITTTSGDRFLIKNAVFRFPLKDNVDLEGRGQTILFADVKHVDIPCSETTPPFGAPPPTSARTGVVTTKSP